MVLARRSAPLADLFRSESERMRGEQSRLDGDGLQDGERSLPEAPVPPVTLD